MDSQKAYDCIPYDLLIADSQLVDCRVYKKNALKVVYSYLTN